MEMSISGVLEAHLLAIDEKLQKLLSYHEASNGSANIQAYRDATHQRANVTGAKKQAAQKHKADETGATKQAATQGSAWVVETTADDESKPKKSKLKRLTTELENLGIEIKNNQKKAKYSIKNRSKLAKSVGKLVESNQFEGVIATVIFLNALFFGVQVDWQVKNHDETTAPIFFTIWEVLCNIIFTIELALRLFSSGLRLYSWQNPNRYWYMFDTFLVTFSLLDELATLLGVSTLNAALIRLFRMFRLARLLRLVRMVRMLHDLRIMVAGIASSMKPLFWATSLIFLLMYIYSIILLQLILEQIIEGTDQELTDELLVYYDSLTGTMYTLSLSTSGGIDWGRAAAPLGEISGFVQLTFVAFIAFSLLCMANVVTGCLVDKALKTTALDEERMMMEDIEERKRWLKDIQRLFDEADKDENEHLDKDEFMEITNDARMRYYLRKIGVDVEVDNVNGIFEFLDIDCDGTVDVDEFTTALQQLHGPARSIDLARIQHALRRLERQLEDVNGPVGFVSSIEHRSPAASKEVPTTPAEMPAQLPMSVAEEPS